MPNRPRTFGARLAAAVRDVGAPVCVGLDPHPARLPPGLPDDPAEAAATFCRGVIDAIAGVVPAVKAQSAFFEALGWQGVRALEAVVAHGRQAGLIVVLDAKRGDIGSTAAAYAQATLPADGPDAVTLSPYLGPESLAPFLGRPGKGAFVLVRTSNPGAGAWQADTGIADRIAAWVEARAAETAVDGLPGDVGAVVGATIPEEAARWRAAMPSAWLLVPGFGAQGGTPETVAPLFRADGLGALVVSARSVLFPPTGRDGKDWPARVHARAKALAATFAPALGPTTTPR